MLKFCFSYVCWQKMMPMKGLTKVKGLLSSPLLKKKVYVRESGPLRQISRHTISIIAPFQLGCNQMPFAHTRARTHSCRTDATGPDLATSFPRGTPDATSCLALSSFVSPLFLSHSLSPSPTLHPLYCFFQLLLRSCLFTDP